MKGITVNLLLEVKTVECRVRNHFFVAGDMDCVRNDFFIFFSMLFLHGLSGLISWRLLVQTQAERIIIYCNIQLLKITGQKSFPFLLHPLIVTLSI